jgi:hypothetical protein
MKKLFWHEYFKTSIPEQDGSVFILFQTTPFISIAIFYRKHAKTRYKEEMILNQNDPAIPSI